ncbi:MAG: hypothetical protein M3Z64_02205 [Verrucomicrobiota bacterium]|nr:hypothetical protein [Verrucomicrobiota bacterium]
MWKGLIVSIFLATAAFAQEHATAYEALRVVGAQLGRAAINHVVSLSGVDGNPQPATWNVLLEDRTAASGLREVQVANGRLVADRAPSRNVIGPGAAASISTSRLNLDSSGAYQVASHTAETSHVVFSYVSYTLRTDPRGNPTWIVTLQSNARQPLGTIHIGANKGNVTRVEGLYSGRNIEQVADDRTLDQPVAENDTEADGDENVVKREIKRAFRRTKHDATRMFDDVRRSFADFIDPRR